MVFYTKLLVSKYQKTYFGLFKYSQEDIFCYNGNAMGDKNRNINLNRVLSLKFDYDHLNLNVFNYF